MKHINELSDILNQKLNWHKARAGCLAQMVCAIIKAKTVNLAQVCLAMPSTKKTASCYRRLQRFYMTLSLINPLFFEKQ